MARIFDAGRSEVNAAGETVVGTVSPCARRACRRAPPGPFDTPDGARLRSPAPAPPRRGRAPVRPRAAEPPPRRMRARPRFDPRRRSGRDARKSWATAGVPNRVRARWGGRGSHSRRSIPARLTGDGRITRDVEQVVAHLEGQGRLPGRTIPSRRPPPGRRRRGAPPCGPPAANSDAVLRAMISA